MKAAVIGLPNSGKTTIFNALTGQALPTQPYPTMEEPPNLGVVRVADDRLERLAEMLRPGKVTPATVELMEGPSITVGNPEQNSKALTLIKDADALLHVIRAFKDDTVIHPLDGVDPLRDARAVEFELLFADLELVDKRLRRMEEAERKGRRQNEAERKALLRCKGLLEEGVPLRRAGLSEEDALSLRHLEFISGKPEVMVLNIHEDEIGGRDVEAAVGELEREFHLPVVTVAGRIEMEISQLDRAAAGEFLREIGLQEPSAARVVRTLYDHLGLISFFTVVKGEVRAWTIRKGTTALKAAGKVHTDIERGFIKAEVISFDDFIRAGSMASAREMGLLRLEGKGYVVQDGEIINFRFNV